MLPTQAELAYFPNSQEKLLCWDQDFFFGKNVKIKLNLMRIKNKTTLKVWEGLQAAQA